MALPIRALTLYKHGISVVERGGEVTGERATLTFHRDQMNDVLKSLVAWDRGGGEVRAVAYDAPEEREARLQRGSIQLSEGATLADLLRDLRGREARVTLAAEGNETVVTGTVVGLDLAHAFPFAQGRLSLLEEGIVRVVRLREIVAVEPLDPLARDDLDYFLRLSTAEAEQRTVTLHLSAGEHDLALRYLVPSPTWRVSYRFVGEVEEAGERRALLQGWGIFDNPFDEPLEGIRVALVSGMPISFVYDLYHPFTPERPEVTEEARVAAAPIEMERGGIAHAKSAMRAPQLAQATRSLSMADAALPPPSPATLAAGTPIAARGEAQGDLFEYRIAHPVDVARGEAAMVPILGVTLPYHKEHIYNGQKMPGHPTIVLRFDNLSELTLERGPITVLEGDSYLGEAILPFSRPDTEVLLAIAVDLGVRVREERSNERETVRVSIEKGFLVQHEYTTLTTRYEARNSNPEAIELLIEHPRTPGFSPLEMAEPEESTEQHRRWRLHVPAGPEGMATFVVRERRLDRSQQQLSTLTEPLLASYLRNRWLDQALANELRGLLALQAAQRQLQEQLQRIEQERAREMNAQEQARKNMSGLKEGGAEGELRARYVQQLAASEDRLATLERERTGHQAEVQRLEEQLRQAIAALT